MEFTLEQLMNIFKDRLLENDCIVSNTIIDCQIVDVELSLKQAWEKLHDR